MPPAPNILFVIADDHQHDALGVRGHPVVRTPTLDRLAADGTSFTRAYIQGGCHPAVCAPSRAALATGCHPLRGMALDPATVQGDEYGIDPARPLLAEQFRKAGWQTHGVGKWHNDGPAFNRSFASGSAIFMGGMSDHDAVPLHAYDPTGVYAPGEAKPGVGFSTEIFCDAAIDFLGQGRDPARPFLLYLSLTSPHDPRTPPPEFARLYDPSRMPLPQAFAPRHPFDNGELGVRDELLLPTPRDPEAVRRHLADYHGMITHHDAQLGRVLSALDKTGEADRTLVVYVSDHGLALGRHGLLGKQNVYDHSVRVPLLLRGPGIPRGLACDRLIYSFDLFPTLCELAGLSAPAGIDARSLKPLLQDGEAAHRESVFSFYRSGQCMVTDGRWKLARYRFAGEERLRLFDLREDDAEVFDRGGDPACAPIRERLESCLDDWERRTFGATRSRD